MAFVKGESGNPGGRPRAVVDVANLARKYTRQNLETLAYWAEQKEDGAVAIRATIALHEIAWGKPAQTQTIQGPDAGPIFVSWLPAQLPAGMPKLCLNS